MCGIAGIYLKDGENAPDIVSLALFSEQHRGQESCGVSYVKDGRIFLHKGMGLVKEVLHPELLKDFRSNVAIGHVRYPTQGGATLENSQPHLIETLKGPIYSVSSNGDLINYHTLRNEMEKLGVHLSTKNDGELIGKFLVHRIEEAKKDVIRAISEIFTIFQGAYSTVFLTPKMLIGFRDPFGFRPMFFGKIKNGYAITSETCAMDILRAKEVREIKPAEIVIVDKDGVEFINTDVKNLRKGRGHFAHCIFEMIYFARPDSFIFGEYVYKFRKRIGRILASYDDFKPDCVVPVPDSSNFIAQGYAEGSNTPFEMGLIRNHYVGRTFIKPVQSFRDESVKQKFNPLKDFFMGKNVVLVDDSIVRGTTLRKIVRMIRGAGAKEIHIRIGSPPVKFPCYFGIDTPTFEELIANRMEIGDIEKYIEADSLKYFRIEDFKKLVGNIGDFCKACFDGKYPVGNPLDSGIEKLKEIKHSV